MPKIRPEDANFHFDNTPSISTGSSSIQIGQNKLTGLTKVDMTSQISGQWISRRVTDLLPAFKNKNNNWYAKENNSKRIMAQKSAI